jgi:hypothetical protein
MALEHQRLTLGQEPHVDAAVCARRGFPPMFIASRNQVDASRFGGGYLLGGLDQAGFAALIRAKQELVGYLGPLYICRDHGGPWQRDEELKARLPVQEAMALARVSLEEDLRGGFNYLHIDPTKCPHPFTQGELADWTLELIAHCEKVRGSLGIRPWTTDQPRTSRRNHLGQSLPPS